MRELPHPSQILKEIFAKKQKRNSKYSISAFARDLKVSQSYLSLLLNGKRDLSQERAEQISRRLDLSQTESSRLIESAKAHKGSAARKKEPQLPKRKKPLAMDASEMRGILRWYTIALLELVTLPDFKSSPQWIAKRLKISESEARQALELLIQAGRLVEKDGKISKPVENLSITHALYVEDVLAMFKEFIERGLKAIHNPAPDTLHLNQCSGLTMPIDPMRVREAKKMVQKFQKDMSRFLKAGPQSEVYQLNVHLFPLSHPVKD